jgi:hypothetical protein
MYSLIAGLLRSQTPRLLVEEGWRSTLGLNISLAFEVDKSFFC